jgi:undecaprenyl-diphosphatase
VTSWLESVVLGCVQGIAEWLPISSEGMLVLVQTNYFGKTQGLMPQVELALFLHLGTFLAALIYLRKEVQVLLQGLFNRQEANLPTP